MDSKEPDVQAAHEFTITAMLPALAGANLIYGIGMFDSGMTWDYAQAVMQDEMVKMILKAVEGIRITDEQIAHDVIRDVGPGGEFITHEHTFRNMRSQSQGVLFDRRSRDDWMASGSPGIVDKAYTRALDIIQHHTPPALSEGVLSALEEMVAEAEAAAKAKRLQQAA